MTFEKTKQSDIKKAMDVWKVYLNNLHSATDVETTLSFAEREQKRIYLENHPEEWIKFFFPKYTKYPFANFQKKAIRRILDNPEWYEVLSWARGLSKSTITMFCVLYLALTGKKKNILLVSSSKDNAERLLESYKLNLENNARIETYYGKQPTNRKWTACEFITKKGVAFRGIGSGQPPRGTSNEEIRPDVVLIDDIDTDEDVLNPDIIEKRWNWWERAVYFTRDASNPMLIVFCGNIIAPDCCIVRAGEFADHWDIINIRDKNGVSSWPEKNSEEDIDRMLSKTTTKAGQAELFNNPISEGEIFKEVKFGKVPNLKNFPFLVVYGDPAPGESKNKKSSTKACWLMGKLNGITYIIKGYLDRVINDEFINWYIYLNQYVNGVSTVFNWMENNKLQDPFFQQVFKPIVAKKRQEQNIPLYIKGDEEKKTDKASRIEARLEPMNREGHLVFNEAEKEDPHMKRLVEQFKLFTPRLKFPADGPDCIEGGERMLVKKIYQSNPVIVIPKSRNKKRL
ncbi:MAG: hypothetical protein LBU51_00715 [Bacteroidales bacterium]|jgi:hypothetical protein|nr:hypothetical protein [Bacteroidales bacterium]